MVQPSLMICDLQWAMINDLSEPYLALRTCFCSTHFTEDFHLRRYKMGSISGRTSPSIESDSFKLVDLMVYIGWKLIMIFLLATIREDRINLRCFEASKRERVLSIQALLWPPEQKGELRSIEFRTFLLFQFTPPRYAFSVRQTSWISTNSPG